MIRFIITIPFLLLAKFGSAQENTTALSEKNYSITLTIDNFSSDSGNFKVALYTKNAFLQTPLKHQTVAIKNKKASVTFASVPAGEYAIVYYHDSNKNSMLDFDQYGRPVEDYGNTGTINYYGPPSFEMAKFTLSKKNRNFNLKF